MYDDSTDPTIAQVGRRRAGCERLFMHTTPLGREWGAVCKMGKMQLWAAVGCKQGCCETVARQTLVDCQP